MLGLELVMDRRTSFTSPPTKQHCTAIVLQAPATAELGEVFEP
jgi:hypothetical protein